MERIASLWDRRRETLFKDLDLASLEGLEIGPLDKPLARRGDGRVTYVDHADHAELRRKYDGDPNVDLSAIVEIDAVWGRDTLGSVVGTGSKDYVVASHVLEHVPDLIGWLQEVEAVLRPDGQLIVVLPDKRMSFDCKRRKTTAVEVMDAFIRKARRPQTYQLLDCALNVVKEDTYKLHTGEARPNDFEHVHTVASALALAQSAFDRAIYVDVHCWTFTPRSFARLMRTLVLGDLIHLSCAWSLDTSPDNQWEFYVKMTPFRSKKQALQSWQAMERQSPYKPGYLAKTERRTARPP